MNVLAAPILITLAWGPQQARGVVRRQSFQVVSGILLNLAAQVWSQLPYDGRMREQRRGPCGHRGSFGWRYVWNCAYLEIVGRVGIMEFSVRRRMQESLKLILYLERCYYYKNEQERSQEGQEAQHHARDRHQQARPQLLSRRVR